MSLQSKLKIRLTGEVSFEDGKLLAIVYPVESTPEKSLEKSANAQRIVACWNAFDGIPTALIGEMPGTVTDLAQNYAKVVEQRDALLEALRDMVSDHESLSEATLKFAKAAIAKAEGGAA